MQKKVLMVCLGNICRSPLAEGILASKVDADKVLVDSAGTSDWHVGKQPDPRSIEVAEQFGIDISHQKARQFTVSDFDRFDKIYVMDNSNYENVIALARNEADKKKVERILNEVSPGKNLEVPDPYYGGDSGFIKVYKMLDEAFEIVAEKLSN
ncbi:MAG TPA: low molecular weight protein-tyrosine-phosphatase [Flavobacteriaceae bacterium]|nr:low molecular weight protein-tyrosine-phosphatase [Flavobacteriaceae bacterium]